MGVAVDAIVGIKAGELVDVVAPIAVGAEAARAGALAVEVVDLVPRRQVAVRLAMAPGVPLEAVRRAEVGGEDHQDRLKSTRKHSVWNLMLL